MYEDYFDEIQKQLKPTLDMMKEIQSQAQKVLDRIPTVSQSTLDLLASQQEYKPLKVTHEKSTVVISTINIKDEDVEFIEELADSLQLNFPDKADRLRKIIERRELDD